MESDPSIRDLMTLISIQWRAAFAVRCAWRVFPLVTPEGYRGDGDLLKIISRLQMAIDLTDRFATDSSRPEPQDVKELRSAFMFYGMRLSNTADAPGTSAEIRNRYKVSEYALGTIVQAFGIAAYAEGGLGGIEEAVQAAENAMFAGAVASDHGANVKAIEADVHRLAQMLSSAQHDLTRLDPSESGPLGKLWPFQGPQGSATEGTGTAPGEAGEPLSPTVKIQYEGDPEWMIIEPQASGLRKKVEESQPEPLISAYFDDSGFTEEEVELCLSYLSEIYREQGGVGLKVVGERTLVPDEVEAHR